MRRSHREGGTTALRWWILALLFLAITINILDRQVLSLVAPGLMTQLHITNTQYGVILMFFMLGMTIGQVPVGQALDRYGVRRGFPGLIFLWSIVNMLHGAASAVAQFCGLRFLLGVAECGTYSAGVKVIGQWFPAEERAFACGIFNSGSLAGAIIAPPVIVWLMTRFGWRAAFVLPGAIGLAWVLPWLRVYRKPPATEDKREPEGAVLVRDLLRLPAVWGVIAIRAFSGPVTQFYWYWLPSYLNRARGMSLAKIGMLAWLPFLCGALGNLGGGWLSSRLIRSGWSINRSRKTVFSLSVGLCLSAVLVPEVSSTFAAMTLLCAASVGINSVAANHIGILTDMFPESVLARVTGLTGVGDGVVSMIMMLVTGIVIDHFSYFPIFLGVGLFPLLVLLSLAILVGPVRRLPIERFSVCSVPPSA
ncbi:MAG TPA: MFS transporter [Opitutaceae bacterium]|nr:MFS transporter [Opitutaceae bacterium]